MKFQTKKIKKLIIAVLSMVCIFGASISTYAASNPVVTSNYNNRHVYSAKNQYIYGKVSVAKNQRIILYDGNGNPISVQRLPNSGGSANYKLPCSTLSKGKNVFIVRSEQTGNIAASNALAVVYYLDERKTNSTSSSSSTTATTTSAGTSEGQRIVDTAMKYVGKVKYKHGGTSLKTGIDCTGFVVAIYNKCGYNFNAHFGSKGKSIGKDIKKAQPGDVIKYKKHWAIYAGNGKVVHSTGGHGVCVMKAVHGNGKIVDIRRYVK